MGAEERQVNLILNIWLLQTGELLPLDGSIKKMRTAILADTLVGRGHSVLWWAAAFDHFKKNWLFKGDTFIDVSKNYKIFAIKGIGYKKNISLSRFIDHRIVAWEFRKLAPKMPKPDVIVSSMPPHDLAYEAVMFAKKNDVPVIVDIRDKWPDIFLDYIPKIFQEVVKAVLYKEFKMLEYTLKNADSRIAMMKSILSWGLKKALREQTNYDKVFYLGAQKNNLEYVGNFNFLEQSVKDKFVVTFIGTFGQCYNPVILTKVAKRVAQYNIHFILGGYGIFFEEVKKESKDLSNTTLTGWLSENEIKYILSFSNVGVVPCNNPTEAFPNKAFTYLSAGLPIISSTLGELKEIIEKYQIGFYYPPNDVDALVNCILKLYDNPELYKKMSENSKRVFDEMFDADKIYEEYARHIERVASEYRNAKTAI